MLQSQLAAPGRLLIPAAFTGPGSDPQCPMGRQGRPTVLPPGSTAGSGLSLPGGGNSPPSNSGGAATTASNRASGPGGTAAAPRWEAMRGGRSPSCCAAELRPPRYPDADCGNQEVPRLLFPSYKPMAAPAPPHVTLRSPMPRPLAPPPREGGARLCCACALVRSLLRAGP